MHVRLSTCLGAAVVDRSSGDALGALSGIFIHPDTGKVEGITVSVPSGMLGSCDVFCGSPDIAHWGAVIQVSGPDALAPLEDRVRFAPILAEKRTVLGQRIRTELGRGLGICRDVQFDTEKMKVEWLFPRTWLRWGIALPLSEVQEVRPDAIIVKDPRKTENIAVTVQEPLAYEAFPEIAEARESL